GHVHDGLQVTARLRWAAFGVVGLGVLAPVWDTELVDLPHGILTVGRAALIVAGALLLYALATEGGWRVLGRKAPRLLIAGYVGLGALILTSAAVNGCGSECQGTVAGFFEVAVGLGLAFAASTLAPAARDRILLAAGAGATIAALLALAGVGPIHTFAGQHHPYGRLSGTLANPNLLGAILGVGIPVLLAFRRRPVWGRRWILPVALAISSITLLLTFSRGGLIAAAVGVTAVLLMEAPHPRRRLAIAGAAAGVALLSVLGYPLFQQARADISFNSVDRVALSGQFESGWAVMSERAMLRPGRGGRGIRISTTSPGQGATYDFGTARAGGAYRLAFQARAVGRPALLTFGLRTAEFRGGARSATGQTTGGWRTFRVAWRPSRTVAHGRLYISSLAGGATFEIRRVRVAKPGGVVGTAPDALGRSYYEKRKLARASDGELNTRMDAIRLGWRAFTHHPVTGLGWEKFPHWASRYVSYGDLATHNEYLRVAVELGLVGLVLFGVLAAGMVMSWRRLGSSKTEIAAKAGVAAGAVGFLFANVLVAPAVSIPFALAAGVLAAGRPTSASAAPSG
ncbi:MAG: O-antigen ligase family protein, partial [Gemmatimonadales bacterium]